jgi:hypothetical protein
LPRQARDKQQQTLTENGAFNFRARNKPLNRWAFGHGLSYSSFEVQIEAEPQPPTASTDDNAAAGEWTAESFAAATATPTTAAAGSAAAAGADLNDFPLSSSALRYSVRVTNTGTVGGGVNLLGFVTASDTAPPPAGFPLQRLFGFTGVDFLEPV